MTHAWPVVECSEGLSDPVRDDLARRGSPPNLESIRSLFPPTTGDPAFDPEAISQRASQLRTDPEVDTGDAHLDHSVRMGLAFIDATFQGDHPKYGVKHYADDRHDGFPPTIIATMDALTSWGLHERAHQLWGYWLANFVRPDGAIRYYGPAVSEYGQLLHTGVLVYERAGQAAWWEEGRHALARIADHVLELCAQAEAKNDLVSGIPEADISRADPNNLGENVHNEDNRYFHNNAWLVRGLTRWAGLVEASGMASRHPVDRIQSLARGLAQRTLEAIEQTWPREPEAWWLSPQLEPCPTPDTLTGGTISSYTNYRYWPELLSSGLLPARLANRVVDARLSGGGQLCGMTRFEDHLNDWPLTEYLYGLWRLGRMNDFLLSLYGHAAFGQAGSHFTAYEQVSLPPVRELAPYCLPCQLVIARAARLLVR